MADLVLTADMSQIVSAEKKTKSFERSIDGLFRRFQSGSADSETFNRGLLEIKRSYASLGISMQKASGQVDKYTRELEKAKVAQDRAADQKEWFATETRKLRMMNDSIAMENKRVASLERLKSKYIPLYSASKQYENALDEINKAYSEGGLAISEYLSAMNGVDAALATQSQRMVGNTRGMNGMGMAIQQTGYQVGDFLVQVQGGTNWMVAFGQQATQLVGVLPMLSEQLGMSAGRLVAISAGLGIAIPLATAIGAAFMRSGEAAENSAGGVKTLEDRIKSLAESMADTRLELDAAFRGMSPEVFDLTNAIEEQILKVAEARNALEEATPGTLRSAFLFLTDPLGAADLDRQAAQIALNRLIEEQGTLEEQITALRENQRDQRRMELGESLTSLAEEASFVESLLSMTEEQAEAASRRREVEQEILGELESIYGIGTAINSSERERIELLLAQEESYREAVRSSEALAAAEGASDALEQRLSLLRVQLQYGEDSAAARAMEVEYALDAYSADLLREGVSETIVNHLTDQARLAGELEEKLNRISQIRFPNLGDDDAMRMIALEAAYQQYADTRLAAPDTPVVHGSSGRSGGGGASADTNRLSALAQSLMSERELVDIWREDSLTALAEFNARELELVGGHAAARAAIEEEYSARIREIRNAEWSNTLSGYGDLFGALGSLMGNSGKKMLQIQAALSAASTMISSYEGAARQAAKASNPITAGAIWASWIARGISAVAKIKQIGSSGNASGGAVGGGGGGGSIATPDGSSGGPQKILIEGLNPGDMISGEMLKELFDRFYDENENRGAVFMVST